MGTVEIDELELITDDLVMLCSDGLNSMVPGDVIEDLFHTFYKDPSELIDNLIREANQYGGDDNITVVLVQKL